MRRVSRARVAATNSSDRGLRSSRHRRAGSSRKPSITDARGRTPSRAPTTARRWYSGPLDRCIAHVDVAVASWSVLGELGAGHSPVDETAHDLTGRLAVGDAHRDRTPRVPAPAAVARGD